MSRRTIVALSFSFLAACSASDFSGTNSSLPPKAKESGEAKGKDTSNQAANKGSDSAREPVESVILDDETKAETKIETGSPDLPSPVPSVSPPPVVPKEDPLITAAKASAQPQFSKCDLQFKQSCPVAPVHGSFLIKATIDGAIVFGANQVGKGRAAFSGDSNVVFTEQAPCQFWEWLGQAAAPARILALSGYAEKPNGLNVTKASAAAVQKYVGQPELLKRDFDVVVFNIFTLGEAPLDALEDTLVTYVRDHGGGLYVTAEYSNGMEKMDQVKRRMDKITRPLGGEFYNGTIPWKTPTIVFPN